MNQEPLTLPEIERWVRHALDHLDCRDVVVRTCVQKLDDEDALLEITCHSSDPNAMFLWASPEALEEKREVVWRLVLHEAVHVTQRAALAALKRLRARCGTALERELEELHEAFEPQAYSLARALMRLIPAPEGVE